MRSDHPHPIDENVIRMLLAREAERIMPRADAQARFLAAVEAQESRQRKLLG